MQQAQERLSMPLHRCTRDTRTCARTNATGSRGLIVIVVKIVVIIVMITVTVIIVIIIVLNDHKCDVYSAFTRRRVHVQPLQRPV